MSFRSRTLNTDLIPEWGSGEHGLSVHLAAPWWAAAAVVSQRRRSRRRVQARASLNWWVSAGTSATFCSTSQSECWRLRTKEQEKVFPVYVFSGLQLFGLLPTSGKRQWQQRIRWRLTCHGKPLMLLLGSKTPSFLETGTLSTATENGPTPRLDGLLMVQNLQGTMSTNQYMRTKTCSERILW